MDWLDDVAGVDEVAWRQAEADRDWSRMREGHVTSGFREVTPILIPCLFNSFLTSTCRQLWQKKKKLASKVSGRVL